METRKEKRTLKYQFSNEELLVLSEELASKNNKLRSQEDEKKSVVSQYGSMINEIKESINGLSIKVSNKYEHRDVNCEIQYHKPEEGIKTITREDTGQSWTEKMSDWDFDLFTQYQGEDPGEDLAEGAVQTDEEEMLDVDGNALASDTATDGTF